MPNRTFSIEELAEYLHLAVSDIEVLVRQSDIPHQVLGGRTVFRRELVDAWVSKRILGLPGKRLDVYHDGLLRRTVDGAREAALIPALMRPEYIDLGLTGKTPSSVIREMVALADRTGRVFDPRELATSIKEREELCSTALPGGLALLHARHLADYRFEESCVVLGRTVQRVPFGAPDGQPTQLFFLICCQDDRIHLHALARLCLVAMKTTIVPDLLAVDTAADAFAALVTAEQAVLPARPVEEKPRSKRHRGD